MPQSYIKSFNNKNSLLIIKWKKKYHAVGASTKSNIEIVETEAKLIPLANNYMTTHVPVQALKGVPYTTGR